MIVFFALLAGFFHPLITYTSFDGVIGGVLILFLGLAGGVLLYRATTSESKTPPASPKNNIKTPPITPSKLVYVISGWKNPASNAKKTTK